MSLRSSNLAKGSAINIVGSIFLKGVAFILIPLYTSVFTPADYGTMELINVVMSVLTIFFSFGFSQLLFLEFTHLSEEDKISFVRKINYSFNILAIPCLIISLGILFVFRKDILGIENTFVLALMIVTVYLSFFQNNIYSILQLEQQPKLVTINKVVAGTTLLLLNVFLIKILDFGISAIYLAYIISLIISITYFQLTSKRTSRYLSVQRTNRREIVNSVKGGLPFILTSMAYFGINGIDRFILKSFLNSDSLGIYALAFKFGAMLEPLLITPILSAYNPVIFKKFERGNFNQNVGFMFLGIIVIFSSIAFVLPLCARYIIDSKFASSIELIPTFVIGFAFFFLSQALAAPIVYFKKKKILVYNVLISALVNVALNIILVKSSGVAGSAQAFLLANIFWFGLTFFQSTKIIKVNKSRLNAAVADYTREGRL